jgi:type II secretory pathway pseudopilin PulG
MRNKGITLMEMVAVITIMALAIPVLLRLYANVASKSIQAEAISAATFYAEEMLEEIRMRHFDNNTKSPWSTVLGPESGEAYPSGYDDVDDYNGRVDTPATGYTRTVTVDYVTLGTKQIIGTYTLTPWLHSATATNYKRVIVSVSRNDNAVANVDLQVIMVGNG